MDSIRDAISESIDELEVGDELEETPQEVSTDYDDEASDDTAQDDDATSALDDKSEGAEDDGETNSAESAPEDEAPSDLNKSNESIKAPASWKPAEREQWSKVPRPLQERIMAREKEISDNLSTTKGARDVNDYVTKMGSHYAPLLESSGFKHPLEAASAALNTMNTLSSGSESDKAQEVARIISQYGIDIQTLDDAIVSGSPNGGQHKDPQTARFEQMLEERMAPFNQILGQQKQDQQRQQQQKSDQAMSEVHKFSESAEFLNDVREDMADIIEIADKRGVQLTLKQAYDRACAANSDINSVMDQRKLDSEVTGRKTSLTSKRAAASSISGRQGGNGGGRQGQSLRDTIMSAMDDE